MSSSFIRARTGEERAIYLPGISYCNAKQPFLTSITPLVAAMCFHLVLDAVEWDLGVVLNPMMTNNEWVVVSHHLVAMLLSVMWHQGCLCGGGDGCSLPIVVRVVHHHPWVVGTCGCCGGSGNHRHWW